MADSLQLGRVTCDFLKQDEFTELCELWLETPRWHHIVTLNPEMVILAERDKCFRQATASADIRVPDGAGLLWARRYLGSRWWPLIPSLLTFSFDKAERITGVETVTLLARLAERNGQGLYLLGGTRAQALGAAAWLKRTWPNLKVHVAPDYPYDARGPDNLLDDIRHSNPAVLLVAYGAPKQTTWLDNNKTSLPGVRIAVGVGGAFAMLSGERPRAPYVLRYINLEWLWRLLLNPRRWLRIGNAVVVFPSLIHKQKKYQ